LAIVGEVTNINEGCSNDVTITYRDSIVEVLSNQVTYETYRFWTVSDACGNARTQVQIIGLIDTLPPSYEEPPIIQVDCEFIPPPDTIVFHDINDVVNITLSEVRLDTPCIDRYTIVRTWTATDGSGNQVSADRIIQVTSCNTQLSASISDESPCPGDFVSLNSSFSHATITNGYYPRWYFRMDSTALWTPVTGGEQSNLSFPAYDFRSGEYRVSYSSQPDHMDLDECQYKSEIFTLVVSGDQKISHLYATICEGETYTIDNATYFAQGDYNIVYPSNMGCDSIVTLHLEVLRKFSDQQNISICPGEYLELTNGKQYYTDGIYYDSLTNVNNCDSIITINLTVATILQSTRVENICTGQSIRFGGKDLTVAGTYRDTLQSTSSCDSIVILDLSVIDDINRTLDVTICNGGSYSFDGFLLQRDTTWTKTFVSSTGCDSLVTLNLQVADVIFTSIFDTTCYQEYYAFGDLNLSQSGIYRNTLPSRYNCDSIIELNLHVREELSTAVDIEICAGEIYPYKDQTYSTSQEIRDTISSINGCDSVLIFNLQVATAENFVYPIPLCEGDSIPLGMEFIKTGGTHTRTLSNAQGCLDSTVTYNVTMIPAYVEHKTITLCEGDSVMINGNYEYSSGNYEALYQSNISGCDSVLTYDVSFEEVIDLWSEDINICEGESFSIIVDGADDLEWNSSSILSCNNCPNPSGTVEQTTTFTATTEGCADQTISIDVTVTVYNEVQIEALTPDTSLTYGQSLILDAFVTDPFSEISWLDQFGNVLCTNCSRTEITPDMNTFYYAEANSGSGCTVRDTVYVNIKDACADGEITVPNFISPNADGVNDDVLIRYQAIRSVNKMRIFNRWGQLVFSTDDIDNNRWDGTIDGSIGNPGVYIYFLEYQCLNGEEVFQKGNITLLK